MFNIKDASDNISEVWKEIKDSSMNAVWQKLWPECVNDFGGFPITEPVVREIVTLSHQVGFNEVTEGDVNNLLDSHAEELTNEDLMAIDQDSADEDKGEDEDGETTPQLNLTRKMLADAMSYIDQGVQILVNNDPNRERSIKAERTIEDALNSYRELYKEKQLRAKQVTLTSFFKQKSPPKPTAQPENEAEDIDHIFTDSSSPTFDVIKFTSDNSSFEGFLHDEEDLDSPAAVGASSPTSQ